MLEELISVLMNKWMVLLLGIVGLVTIIGIFLVGREILLILGLLFILFGFWTRSRKGKRLF